MFDLIRDIISKGIEINRVLDIGANSAQWSIELKKVCPNAEVYLMEPLPQMKIYLEDFCAKNIGCKYFMNAAGDKNETLYITTYGEDITGSNLLAEEDDYLKSVKKQVPVEVITIDSLVENKLIQIPQLTKIDVQGYELKVLQGASKLFGTTEIFIIEVTLFAFNPGSSLAAEVIQYMNENDYVIYDVTGFLRRPLDNALAQMDICFVKKNGLLRQTNAWSAADLV